MKKARNKNVKSKYKKLSNNKKKVLLVALYILVVLFLAFAIYIIPSLAGAFERTYIAEHGEINVTIDTDAYIIRDEGVYISETATGVNRVAKEEELVRGGTTIVELAGEGKVLKDGQKSKYADTVSNLGESKIVTSSGASVQSGYVVYYVDGAEGKLTYSALKTMTKEQLSSVAEVSPIKTIEGKCVAGDPVFKIVDNGTWWIVTYVDSEDGKRFIEGNSVELTSGNETVRAFVDSVKKGSKEEKGTTRVVLSCQDYMKGYLTDRKISAKITTESAEGLIIKNSSIVVKKGMKGVLTINKMGKHVFEPIDILADDGSQSCVSEGYFMDSGGNLVKTVSTYDEVVTSPSKNDVKNALE